MDLSGLDVLQKYPESVIEDLGVKTLRGLSQIRDIIGEERFINEKLSNINRYDAIVLNDYTKAYAIARQEWKVLYDARLRVRTILMRRVCTDDS